MRVKCAWCLRTIRGEGEPTTHGICPECAKLLSRGDKPAPIFRPEDFEKQREAHPEVNFDFNDPDC